MKRVLILILVFALVSSFPCVALAEDIYEEETAPVGNIVNSPILNYVSTLQIYDLDWNLKYDSIYKVGDDLSFSYPTLNGFIYRFGLSISSFLTDRQKYLLKTSVSTTLIMESTVDFYSDPSFSNQDFEIYGYCDVDSKDTYDLHVGPFTQQPSNSMYEIELGDYFYGSNLEYFTLFFLSYFYGYGDRLVDMQYSVKELSLIIRTVGADESTADIVVNLGKIEDSINQGFDNLGNQIGGVQDDINSGFNEVGGKLDSMLTPDSNNQQAVDQMGGQVGNNKQEAEDIKNQIDSLNKPDPDELIDQMDPDQFIDNDNEAVQEMTGILASVTSNKVVKNYLLLLLGIGIVSFVVYGKKGG